MSRIAHFSRPEIQARHAASAKNPEFVRRQAIARAAKGRNRREIASHWMVEWNLAGRPVDFPELAEWEAAKRASGWESHYERCTRLNREAAGLARSEAAAVGGR